MEANGIHNPSVRYPKIEIRQQTVMAAPLKAGKPIFSAAHLLWKYGCRRDQRKLRLIPKGGRRARIEFFDDLIFGFVLGVEAWDKVGLIFTIQISVTLVFVVSVNSWWIQENSLIMRNKVITTSA